MLFNEIKTDYSLKELFRKRNSNSNLRMEIAMIQYFYFNIENASYIAKISCIKLTFGFN